MTAGSDPDTGTVKFFSEDRGYGFIVPDGGGDDVFVHWSGIAGDGYRNLVQDQKVMFEVVAGDKGPQASNVQPLPGDAT